jgi:OmcA/MtrC family decaheme c-type cytochrome
VKVGWSTTDYTNTGNSSNNAQTISVNALTSSLDLGNGVFEVTLPVAIPDGSLAPNIPATGSGAVVIEPRPAEDFGTLSSPDVQNVPVPMAVGYFSINEMSGTALERREVVKQENCLGCHGQLVKHGGNRTDSIAGCVTCHNPRNTDKRARDVASTPPTDGTAEESIDFKTMIHGIHAAGYRNQPLQIVGFSGFSTHVYDEDVVRFPGKLGNCATCHSGDSFTIPLGDDVLAPTLDTGADIMDPSDDRVISTTAAICSSCHDGTSSRAHMEANGGDFNTTQIAIDTGTVLEQCEICHGPGRVLDVSIVHPLN